VEQQTYEAEILAVKHWLQEFIVGYNLCPFAKKPLVQNQIDFEIIIDKKRTIILEKFLAFVKILEETPAIETTLIIFPASLKDFYQYLETMDLCTSLLVDQGYEGVFQLASFHPDYYFEGEDESDASHFTNRAPFPIIHIIREASIEQVLKTYKNPEDIPVNNIEKMRELGVEYLQKKLDEYL
jgi:hypothetical protein